MYGSHLSIAGGMVNALTEAKRLRVDCVQVFTKNQRQWKVTPLRDDDVAAWLEQLHAMGWDDPSGPSRVVSHNSYLINMASPDKTAWKRSVDLQRIELERCETLRIPLCVAHPGAHLGETIPPGPREGSPESPSADEAGGLDRIVRALDRIHADLPGYRTITCLETTVGSGTNLGYDFRHLAWIRDRVAAPERVAFCFDTCHVTAAGYDMSTPKGAKATMRAFDDSCGLEGIRAFHVNDSEGNIGSRRDRHAHIGDGTCGRSCFQAILAPRFDRVPRILETGKESTPKGTPMDTVNIRRLKRLARESTRSR